MTILPRYTVAIEKKLLDLWDNAKVFKATASSETPPYSLVIPPPNITGSLHMGHALNNTLQDILCRFHRLEGKEVLWIPGVDHAGIATQLMVERDLEKQNLTRTALGREKFQQALWTWVDNTKPHILQQLKDLGCSCDFSRQRFTLDKGYSKAVQKVFITLYRDGLIYRSHRLVNWDCQLQTAISDLEVISKEEKGTLYYLQYPLVGDTKSLTVATTRPETLFGDTAVAVHPEDTRFSSLVGQRVQVPLTNRTVPVIADSYADPAKGSGVVKITPAHDFQDFQVGKRHRLPSITILTPSGDLNEHTPLQGMERRKARQHVIDMLKKENLLDKIQNITHTVPYGERSKTIIEPRLMLQWFLDVEKMAPAAIESVRKGEVTFFPKSWEKTYFHWMRNIEPWCISRQLWWGHSIPAWYGPDQKIFVAETLEAAQQQAKKTYGKTLPLTPETDVLDTWFSSALWPFSTMGWPEKTQDFTRYYPTSVLSTGFDIIFFWVARMILMSLYFTHKPPFKHVYIHNLVLDEKGQKMSKTKGNVINPQNWMNTIGTDALRFTLSSMAAQGTDIKLSEQRTLGYRNFITKIWNAARFCFLNNCQTHPNTFSPLTLKNPWCNWILHHLITTRKTLKQSLASYRFDAASHALYHFTWHRLCDWYLEYIKYALPLSSDSAAKEIRHTTSFILDETLKCLHPFIPFVTEELWQYKQHNSSLLAAQTFSPLLNTTTSPSTQQDKTIPTLIAYIEDIRTAKADIGLPQHQPQPLALHYKNPKTQKLCQHYQAFLYKMTKMTKDSKTTKGFKIVINKDIMGTFSSENAQDF